MSDAVSVVRGHAYRVTDTETRRCILKGLATLLRALAGPHQRGRAAIALDDIAMAARDHVASCSTVEAMAAVAAAGGDLVRMVGEEMECDPGRIEFYRDLIWEPVEVAERAAWEAV
ncbi:MAG: hypothetical protein AAGD07_00620 [Planctomycetota bacterium]